MMEWNIEWNSECTQLQLTGIAQLGELPSISLRLLSHCRSFMSKSVLPTCLYFQAWQLTHHQVLSSGGLAKPESHIKSKSLALQD